MKLVSRTAAVLLAAGLTLAMSASPASACGRPAVERVLHQGLAETGLPGLVVEVRDEHGRWTATAGVADRETERERSPRDRFRIGSTSKTFTATVVLQLVAE